MGWLQLPAQLGLLLEVCVRSEAISSCWAELSAFPAHMHTSPPWQVVVAEGFAEVYTRCVSVT